MGFVIFMNVIIFFLQTTKLLWTQPSFLEIISLKLCWCYDLFIMVFSKKLSKIVSSDLVVNSVALSLTCRNLKESAIKRFVKHNVTRNVIPITQHNRRTVNNIQLWYKNQQVEDSVWTDTNNSNNWDEHPSTEKSPLTCSRLSEE